MTLSHDAARLLLGRVMSLVSAEVYARASRRKFNQIGAIKFDADVRSLVSLFEGLCAGIEMDRAGEDGARGGGGGSPQGGGGSGTGSTGFGNGGQHGSRGGAGRGRREGIPDGEGVRAKFSKLSQMAFVLALETVDDIEDCWAEGALVSPPLGADTLRKIVGMRSDLPAGAAKSLCL